MAVVQEKITCFQDELLFSPDLYVIPRPGLGKGVLLV